MKGINLCLVDIDDTFIGKNKECPEINVKAIKEMRKKGIYFGIATGRPVDIVPRLFKEWGLEGEVDYVIGSNGAEILNCFTGIKKEQFLLSCDKIKKIEKELSQLFYASICVYEGTTLVTNKSTPYYIARCNSINLTMKVVDMNTYIQKSYPKMLVVSSPEEQTKILKYYQNKLNKEYKLVSSSSILLEVIDPELSKVRGILEVCKDLGISKEEVICFGDAMNDYEMLHTFTGVCVSNAVDEIKSICKYQTGSCDEGGVGQFIFKYLI